MPKTKYRTKGKKTTKKETETKDIFTKDFKGWVEATFNQYKAYFLVDHLRLKFYYNPRKVDLNEGTAVFSIDNNTNYHMASVHVYPVAQTMYNDKATNELKKGIIHELSHVHTTKLGDLAKERYVTNRQVRDEVENLTDIISEYIYRYITINEEKNNK